MKKALILFFWALALMTFTLGCASNQVTVYNAFEGPSLDPKETAIVHHDEDAYITVSGVRPSTDSVVFKPGEHTILVDYYLKSYRGSYSLKELFKIKITLKAGHEYQLLSSTTMFMTNFSAEIVDVTTDEDVLNCLDKASGWNQKHRAVTKLRNLANVEKVALTHPSSSIRNLAVDRIESPEVLRQINDNDIDASVRKSAGKRLKELNIQAAPPGASKESQPAQAGQ